MIDPLTKLHNRRAYNEDIPKGLAMTYKREKKNCSLLFLDLDFFKGINDTHGHDAGDAVLKEFADMIKTIVREYDITYRFGGEEFIVFLPDADLRVAKEVAERIRKEVAGHIFNATNEKNKAVELKITVSIGYASTESPDINEEMDSKGILDKLGKKSDSALYRAKKSGRNRVLSFDEIPAKTNNS